MAKIEVKVVEDTPKRSELDISIADILNRPFWIWFLISVVCVIWFALVDNSLADRLSAVIMSLFFMIPVRDWLYRIVIFEVNWMASRNTDVKDAVNPLLTYSVLLDTKQRKTNEAAYRMLRVGILTICGIIAIIWQLFPMAAGNLVFMVLHTMEFLVRGRYSWWTVFFVLLMYLFGLWHLRWVFSQFLNAKFYEREIDSTGKVVFHFSPNKAISIIARIIGGLVLRVIATGLLLKVGWSMILFMIILWVIIFIAFYALVQLGSGVYLKIKQANTPSTTTT